MNAEEREERLRRIRERQEHNKSAVNDREQAIPQYLTTAYSDIDFLFSLLDSQAPRPAGWQTAQVAFDNPRMVKVVFETPECAEAFIDSVEPADGPIVAATRMRDLCVDALKSLRATPHGAAYNNAINDAIHKLESLTLDQVEKKQC